MKNETLDGATKVAKEERERIEKNNDIVPHNMELTRSLFKGADDERERIIKEIEKILTLEENLPPNHNTGRETCMNIRTLLANLKK